MHFEAALRIDPDHIHAHRGMGNLLAELGDAERARRHRDRGFEDHALTVLPYRGEGAPFRYCSSSPPPAVIFRLARSSTTASSRPRFW